jgi:dTDP-4-amino-4,6-dideoxygalactose transaminase
MTLLLRALRRLAAPGRDEVILPSYTCYSVAASIVKAGLKPRVVDISPETLDYAPDQLAAADFSSVLAVIATNLYGQPNNLPSIARTAREAGVFLIDDAAQAMGASVGGRWCGTWGDAGLFSFDKGKNVSAIDGGVVVTDSGEIARALELETIDLPSPGPVATGINVAKAIAYFVMLRPWLYWIPNRIPQLSLGKTVYTTDFSLERPAPALVSLAATMMPRLDEFARARSVNAEALLDRLNAVSGVASVVPTAGATSAWLRLPVLFADANARDRAIEALNRAGIGASGSYPASIADVPELRQMWSRGTPMAAGGRYVASHIVTLPTHPFVDTADIDLIANTIAKAVNSAPAIGVHSRA